MVDESLPSKVVTMSDLEAAPAGPDPGPRTPIRHLTQLPIEIQRNILQHCSSSDHIAMSLVSRHFHPLACAQLYRTFSIVFPDEDDPAFESPIDGLAGGLDSMVTSSHDYAQYLREISLDSLSGGVRGEKSYKYYSYGESCGKFMNTLLVLTMRKAKALETFHWNIRVELSRPLYRTLHQIHTLKHLQIRLQAGPSLHLHPPPLPSLSSASQPPPLPTPLYIASDPPGTTLLPPTTTTLSSKFASLPPPPATKEKSKAPPTLSGFKNLQSLCILDMDSLDYLAELATCVRNSTSTLKKLKLSLSESLAMRARKPVPEDSDDSDQEIDEFGQVVIQPVSNLPLSPAALPEGSLEKEAKIRAERSNQEAVLGKVFGLEKLPAETKKDSKRDDGKSDTDKQQARTEKARRDFEIKVKAATMAFLKASSLPAKTSLDVDDESTRAIHDAAHKLAMAYLLRITKPDPDEEAGTASSEPAAVGESSAVATPVVEGKGKGKEIAVDVKADPPIVAVNGDLAAEGPASSSNASGSTGTSQKEPVGHTEGETDGSGPAAEGSLFDKPKHTATSVQPGDPDLTGIDLEHPDTCDEDDTDDVDDAVDGAEPKSNFTPPFPIPLQAMMVVASQKAEMPTSAAQTEASEVEKAGTPSKQAEPSTNVTGSTPESASTPSDAKERELTGSDQALKDYVRSTRKLPLDTLSLYLIPVKASILARAVDLTILRRITLLNVGPQVPFWTTMSNLNKLHPLKLEYIHTDNVTPKFLALVSSLPKLTEVYLLERSGVAKVESLSGKTTVGIDEIRKQVLRPHLKTLKKIMIKNDDNYAWDVDVKAMRLITKRGKGLEELAISMGLRSFHLLLQYLPGLVHLRALHIVSFHTDDTCAWVMRELRKFAIDNVAHHPDLKLEYIGLDHTVERLLRKPKTPKKPATPRPAPQAPMLNGTSSSSGSANMTNGASSSSGSANATNDTGPADKVPAPDGSPGISSPAEPEKQSIPATSTAIDEPYDHENDDTSSSEGSGDDDKQPLLKIETLDNIKLYDVYGVRIFRKDVVAGRL